MRMGTASAKCWGGALHLARPDAVPAHAGWVRIEWQATGYAKNYRLKSITARRGELVVAPSSDRAHDLEDLPKGELQQQHLRCTFGYRSGTKYAHYAKFDIRPEACKKVADFEHGDVVTDRNGTTSTCIGLKWDSSEKIVEMWFHVDGKEGAGVYSGQDLDTSLRKVGHRSVQEVGREDVEGASDGEIEHDERDWVARNLQPTLRYKTRTGRLMAVDTRPEMIAKFRVPYKSGDVLQDRKDGEKMTCIGVAQDPKHAVLAQASQEKRGNRVTGSIAELWFHVEGSEGAGVNVRHFQELSRYTVVGTRPVEPMAADSDAGLDPESIRASLRELRGQLCCDFTFPRGTSRGTDAGFDVRPDLVKKITGWEPGTVVKHAARPDARLTLIGIAEDDDGCPAVWWHYEDADEKHPGAGRFDGWEALRDDMTATGERRDLAVLRQRLRATEQCWIETQSGPTLLGSNRGQAEFEKLRALEQLLKKDG